MPRSGFVNLITKHLTSSGERRPFSKESKGCLLSFLVAVAAIPAWGQKVTLLKDINPGAPSSWPGFSVAVGTVPGLTAIYMVADDGLHGSELWKSNGTAAGTTLVKDINPNGDGLHPGASFPAAILGSTLLFSANDGQHGWELWRSDGTGTGTVMVKDIRGDGDASSFPWNFTTHGSTVFFTADDRTHGKELWRTDGTSLGTELVKNINTFAESWMTDYDIGSDPATLTSHGAYVYFLASQMELNQSRTGVLCHGKLWRTDGTEAGTIALKQVPGDSCYAGWKIRLLSVSTIQPMMFLLDDGVHGEELWVTDGTSAGTQILKDINPGASSSLVRELQQINGTLYFLAHDGIHGYEIWRTDGTPAGTSLVKDVNPTGDVVYSGRWHDLSSTLIGTSLYFVPDTGTPLYDRATDTWTSMEIWKTDGTAAGTVKVTNFGSGQRCPAPYALTAVGSTLFYLGRVKSRV